MPNYVQNYMKITGSVEEINRFWKDQCDESVGHFSFRRIVPMSKTLMIQSGSISYACKELVEKLLTLPSLPKAKEEFQKIFGEKEWFEDLPGSMPENLDHLSEIPKYLLDGMSSPKTKEDAIVLGYTMIQNEKKYGFQDWYGWSNANWGTKWDAMEVSADRESENEISICFQTAWSAPDPIYQVLTVKYPKLNFDVQFADEDLGSNCGTFKAENGILSFEAPGNEEESFDFACKVWDLDPDEERTLREECD